LAVKDALEGDERPPEQPPSQAPPTGEVEPIRVGVRHSADTPQEGLDLAAAPTGDGTDQVLAVTEDKVLRATRLVTNIVAELADDPGMRMTQFEQEDLVPIWTAAINESLQFRRVMEHSDRGLALAGGAYSAYWRGRRWLEKRRRRAQGGQEEEAGGYPPEDREEIGEGVTESGGKRFFTGQV
jgi:hypothetical protein